ncbi:MAG: tRNA (adenosine(37)-N6)-threonylcarbamoyltransferase complex dimerization subunit type 1 TsaB [Desulfovibrio sp.]|nr:tRNA (adenosine(37)-N6)-threonylcarbamoyltransferase complex dimerization subunit type 1 TsaB [Desulfovibrio sp.]
MNEHKKYGTGLELILNACEGCLQIAITDDEEPICFEEWFAPNKATEILAPALKAACDRARISPRAFRRIACFAGPGSFTGIRLALATASGLMRTSRAQLAGLNYLQGLATAAAIWRGLLYPSPIHVITRARRDLVQWQEFISYGPQIPAQPKFDIRLVSPLEAREAFSLAPCHVCGSALSAYPEIFNKVGGQTTLMPELVRPSLESLRLLARHGDYFPKDIEPLYVRSCDAEENIGALAAKRGSNAEETREKMRFLLSRDPLESDFLD